MYRGRIARFVGTRTHEDVVAGKVIRQDEQGFDNFSDYFTDSDDDESDVSSRHSAFSNRSHFSRSGSHLSCPTNGRCEPVTGTRSDAKNAEPYRDQSSNKPLSKILITSGTDMAGSFTEQLDTSTVKMGGRKIKRRITYSEAVQERRRLRQHGNTNTSIASSLSESSIVVDESKPNAVDHNQNNMVVLNGDQPTTTISNVHLDSTAVPSTPATKVTEEIMNAAVDQSKNALPSEQFDLENISYSALPRNSPTLPVSEKKPTCRAMYDIQNATYAVDKTVREKSINQEGYSVTRKSSEKTKALNSTVEIEIAGESVHEPSCDTTADPLATNPNVEVTIRTVEIVENDYRDISERQNGTESGNDQQSAVETVSETEIGENTRQLPEIRSKRNRAQDIESRKNARYSILSSKDMELESADIENFKQGAMDMTLNPDEKKFNESDSKTAIVAENEPPKRGITATAEKRVQSVDSNSVADVEAAFADAVAKTTRKKADTETRPKPAIMKPKLRDAHYGGVANDNDDLLASQPVMISAAELVKQRRAAANRNSASTRTPQPINQSYTLSDVQNGEKSTSHNTESLTTKMNDYVLKDLSITLTRLPKSVGSCSNTSVAERNIDFDDFVVITNEENEGKDRHRGLAKDKTSIISCRKSSPTKLLSPTTVSTKSKTWSTNVESMEKSVVKKVKSVVKNNENKRLESKPTGELPNRRMERDRGMIESKNGGLNENNAAAKNNHSAMLSSPITASDVGSVPERHRSHCQDSDSRLWHAAASDVSNGKTRNPTVKTKAKAKKLDKSERLARLKPTATQTGESEDSFFNFDFYNRKNMLLTKTDSENADGDGKKGVSRRKAKKDVLEVNKGNRGKKRPNVTSEEDSDIGSKQRRKKTKRVVPSKHEEKSNTNIVGDNVENVFVEEEATNEVFNKNGGRKNMGDKATKEWTNDHNVEVPKEVPNKRGRRKKTSVSAVNDESHVSGSVAGDKPRKMTAVKTSLESEEDSEVQTEKSKRVLEEKFISRKSADRESARMNEKNMGKKSSPKERSAVVKSTPESGMDPGSKAEVMNDRRIFGGGSGSETEAAAFDREIPRRDRRQSRAATFVKENTVTESRVSAASVEDMVTTQVSLVQDNRAVKGGRPGKTTEISRVESTERGAEARSSVTGHFVKAVSALERKRNDEDISARRQTRKNWNSKSMEQDSNGRRSHVLDCMSRASVNNNELSKETDFGFENDPALVNESVEREERDKGVGGKTKKYIGDVHKDVSAFLAPVNSNAATPKRKSEISQVSKKRLLLSRSFLDTSSCGDDDSAQTDDKDPSPPVSLVTRGKSRGDGGKKSSLFTHPIIVEDNESVIGVPTKKRKAMRMSDDSDIGTPAVAAKKKKTKTSSDDSSVVTPLTSRLVPENMKSGPSSRKRRKKWANGTLSSVKRKKSVTYSETLVNGPVSAGTPGRSILKRSSMKTPNSPETTSGCNVTFGGATSSPVHYYQVDEEPGPTPFIPKKIQPSKIIRPREMLSGLRRSQRTRVLPLAWYKNERIKYSKRKSGGYLISNVISPNVKDDPPKRRNKPKKTVMGRRNKRLSTHVQLSHSVVFAENDGEIPVIYPEIGEEVLLDCVATTDQFLYSGPGNREPTADDKLLIAKPIQQPAFSCGSLIIRGLQQKQRQFVNNDTLIFNVMRGKLAVTIHETATIIEEGGMFFVPRGNWYSIKNLRRDDAKLSFTQLKSALVDEEEQEQEEDEEEEHVQDNR